MLAVHFLWTAFIRHYSKIKHNHFLQCVRFWNTNYKTVKLLLYRTSSFPVVSHHNSAPSFWFFGKVINGFPSVAFNLLFLFISSSCKKDEIAANIRVSRWRTWFVAISKWKLKFNKRLWLQQCFDFFEKVIRIRNKQSTNYTLDNHSKYPWSISERERRKAYSHYPDATVKWLRFTCTINVH